MDILQPQNIHGAIKLVSGNARSLAVVLDSPAVAVKLSAHTGDCILQVINSCVDASQKAASLGNHGQNSGAVHEADLELDAEKDRDQEDLRCGLFEKTQVAASRPGLSFVPVASGNGVKAMIHALRYKRPEGFSFA